MAYRVTVDHDRPLAELIAAGGFAYANPQITETLFPSCVCHPSHWLC